MIISRNVYKYGKYIIKRNILCKSAFDVMTYFHNIGIPTNKLLLQTIFFDLFKYVPGDTYEQIAFDERLFFNIVHYIAEIHKKSPSIDAFPNVEWEKYYLREIATPTIISHCDITPNNIICKGNKIVAFIDWELSGPINHLVDFARSCWLLTRKSPNRRSSIEQALRIYGFDDIHSFYSIIINVIEMEIQLVQKNSENKKAYMWRKNDLDWFVNHYT